MLLLESRAFFFKIMFDQTDDLKAMFDTDDFGEIAVFTVSDPSNPPSGTMPKTINVIYETSAGTIGIYDRSFFDEKFYSAIVDTQKDFFLAITTDCTGIKRNTPVVFRGSTWYVFKTPLDDGTNGISLMFISKDQA